MERVVFLSSPGKQEDSTPKRKRRPPAEDSERPPNVERVTPSDSRLDVIPSIIRDSVPDTEDGERPRSWWKKER